MGDRGEHDGPERQRNEKIEHRHQSNREPMLIIEVPSA